MNKTFHVAFREFLDNVRTKTFWIGIFIVPVLIAVSMLVVRLLSEAKDVRAYAVLDRSEGRWLSEAIRARRDASDLDRIRKQVTAGRAELDGRRAENADTPPAELRATLRAALDRTDDDLRRRVLEFMIGLPDDDLPRFLDGDLRALLAHTPALQRALAGIEPQELLARFGGLSTSKYREVTVDLSGDDDPEETLRGMLARGDIFAYFVVPEDPVASSAGSKYVSNNLTDDGLRSWYSTMATEVVRERRIAELALTREQAASLRAGYEFASRQVSETGEEQGVEATDKLGQWAPMAFVYLLWIMIFTTAQMLLTNTIEEKSNRIIEVLLSSVSPLQLMSGKVFGIAATGLTIICSWALFALAAVEILPYVVPDMQIDLASIVGNPRYLASFIGYFLTGYLFYAAILVAVGSVCNSLKEAQNLMQPVIIVLFVPLAAMFPIASDPNGTVAKIMTYIPLFTPFTMMNRAGGPPSALEYVISSAIIAVSVAVAFWGAAKVFRIGVLMTGKPPRVTEILGWLKAPVGTVAVSDATHDPAA